MKTRQWFSILKNFENFPPTRSLPLNRNNFTNNWLREGLKVWETTKIVF